jgi:CRP-like cAMP-binding protein
MIRRGGGNVAGTWWPELRRGDLVAYLTEHELPRLLAATQPCDFEDGATVFRKGEASESLAVIEQGEVDVVDESLPEPLAVVGPGGVVGEVGFLDGRARTHDVRARGRCRVRVLTRDRFLALAHDDPALTSKLAVAMAELVVKRFRSVVQELEPVRAFSAALREPLEHGEPAGPGFDEIDEPLPEGALDAIRAACFGAQKGSAGL